MSCTLSQQQLSICLLHHLRELLRSFWAQELEMLYRPSDQLLLRPRTHQTQIGLVASSFVRIDAHAVVEHLH